LGLILRYLFADLGKNGVAFLAACVIPFLPRWRPHDLSASLIRPIAGAAAVATVSALIVNYRSPLVVDRYFTFLAVELMVIITLIIVPALTAQPKLATLVTANAAVFLIHTSIAVCHDRRWLADADMVAQLVAQCPETRVHAGSRPPKFGPDPAEIIGPVQGEEIGLANIAVVDHLTLLPLSPDTPTACPVIYWTEYRGPTKLQIAQHHDDIVSAANDSAGFGLDAAALANAKAIPTASNFGIILVVTDPAKR